MNVFDECKRSWLQTQTNRQNISNTHTHTHTYVYLKMYTQPIHLNMHIDVYICACACSNVRIYTCPYVHKSCQPTKPRQQRKPGSRAQDQCPTQRLGPSRVMADFERPTGMKATKIRTPSITKQPPPNEIARARTFVDISGLFTVSVFSILEPSLPG